MSSEPFRKPNRYRLLVIALVALTIAGGVAVYGIVQRAHSAAQVAQWTDQQAIPTVALASLQRGPGARKRGILAAPISGTAVLEYGPAEILPPVGAISKHPARLCRPGRQASRAQLRGKPGFSTFESGCGRETDCLLEGDGFEPSVPRAMDGILCSLPMRVLQIGR